MDEVQLLFKKYPNYDSIEEYDRFFELLEVDEGISISSKEDNGFIDIEYNNKMGEYKAKLLIEYFNMNKKFFQYFLKYTKKIVISNHNNTNSDEIFLNNSPGLFDTYYLLKQLLPDMKYSRFLSSLVAKIDNVEIELLDKNSSLELIKQQILNLQVNLKKIDQLTYLDLLDGRMVNVDLLYDKAIIDMTFEKGYFGWLDLYIKGENTKEIKTYALRAIYDKYSLILFNELLNRQSNLLTEYSDIMSDDFLEKNIYSLKEFFNIELADVFSKFKNIDTNKDKKKMSKNEIINLVISFLDSIDCSKRLSSEFRENIKLGNIMLWNKNNPSEKTAISSLLSNFHISNIEEPVCATNYNENNEVSEIVVNIPLTYTLDDVRVIIHEFFHLHSNLSSKNNSKNKFLNEFPSIYFEEVVVDFLKEKGYSEYDLDINFRVFDSLLNFDIVMPIIKYLVKYRENGFVNIKMLSQDILEIQQNIINNCLQKNMSMDEVDEKLKLNGVFGDTNQIIFNLVFNLNSILLLQKRSIFNLTPYLLGTIFTNSAIKNCCSMDEIIKLSDNLNSINDITEVMNIVGIDASQYGFCASNKISR